MQKEHILMSRGEELRAKFKAKGAAIAAELNSPAGIFRSALFSFIREFCNAGPNQMFADVMFERFLAEAPADRTAWFNSKVRPLFIHMVSAPLWVDEPDWCYHDGIPMEFMHQFIDDNATTFYVFRGIHPSPYGGTQSFYKMSAQRSGATIRFSENLIK
jgi:hypothetical protein